MLDVAVIDPSLFTRPYDHELCDALAAAQCRVTLYGRGLRSNESELGKTATAPFFYRYSERVRGAIKGTPFLALKGAEHFVDMARLKRHLLNHKPDAIHFQWAPLPVIDKRFIPALRQQCPVVLTVHDITPYNNSLGGSVQKIGSLDSLSTLKLFDHLIVHSESSRATLIERGIEPSRISTIPHGIIRVSKSAAQPIANRAQATILLFGTLRPYKGADVLIEAFGKLPPDLKRQSRIVVVGQPMFDIAPLKHRAAELGIAENIVWDMRFVPNAEIDVIMGQADIFAFPYREIDTSGVLMSCFPYGKPIVASKIGAFAALVEEDVHGHLVAPDDAAALSEALAHLIRDPNARERYGRNVTRIADTIPSWDDIAARTIDIYRNASLRR